MKKTIAIVIVLSLLLPLVMAGCYASKPGKMSDLVGTYQLTSFTRTYSTDPKDEEGHTEPRDLIAEREIEACYLVVGDQGEGYYVYATKDACTVRKVRITYTYSEDEPDRVKEIYYTDGGSDSGTNYPGKFTERLGVYCTRKEKSLSYSSPAIFGQKYSQSAKYTKVDKATDLSYASKQLGQTLIAADYEVALLSGWQTLEGNYDEALPYVYYYMNVDMARKTADVYYALKSDQRPIERKGQTVTYTLGEDGQPIRIAIGNDEFWADGSVVPVRSMYLCNDEGQPAWWFNNMGVNYPEAESNMQQCLQNYADSLAAQEGQE